MQGIDGELCRLSEARLTSLEAARLHAQRDGSFFTGVQRRKYDNLSDGKCVLCGADDDIEHRCLHCPGLAGIRAGYPDIEQLWASSPTCMRERLLPPRNGLYQQVKHQLFSLPITADCSEVTADVGQEVHLFTDGSCSTERLPSLRLASWSVVSATHSRVVAFGPLHGLPQTINRAELTAVISAAEWLGACRASGVIYTDSAYVAKGAWRLLHDRADLPKSNGDLWKLLSLAVDAMPAGSLGIRHVSGHLDANSCDDPIDEWAARWNDEADKAAKFANCRRHATFMQSWSAYRDAELGMQRRLDQLIRLHLDIAEQLSKHPAAYRLDVDDELEAELPQHVGLLVARPEAQHSWAEWIVPQDAINMHLAASFGQAFFESAFNWIRQQQQSADAWVCLSWLEVVAVLRTEGVPFPVSVSSPHGNVWKDASQYGSYTNAQATVVSDLMLVRSFFRAVASAYGVNIGEIRGLNLAALRVGPPQSGLSISCTRSALLQAEQALGAFTLTRPVRSANDLSRPFR